MTLQTNMEFIASLCSALFAGAAVYVNAVEHPARMSCGVDTARAEWAPSYTRAKWMQAPLAIVGFSSAALAWLLGASVWWLVGGMILGLVAPFTIAVIKPTNKRLFSAQDNTTEETRQLLDHWNRLHAVRTIFGLAALVIFLLAR